MLTISHDQPAVDTTPKKKPEVILCFNEQRCGVDIVNRMIKDVKSQGNSDNYGKLAFTLVIDLAIVDAQTILKYNQNESMPL